jgi:hypothetical protein
MKKAKAPNRAKATKGAKRPNPASAIAGFIRSKSGRIASICCAAALIVCGGALLAYRIFFAPMVIVACGLDAAETRSLRDAAAAYRAASGAKPILVKKAAAGKTPWDYAGASRKADIVCFRPEAGATSLSRLFSPVPARQGDLISMSLRIPTQTDSGMYALPLTVGHFELSYDRVLFRQKGLKPPLSLKDFEADADSLAKSGSIPLAIAGKDDDSLLALAAYFVAGPRGLAPYEAFCKNLSAGKSFEETLHLELDGPDGSFSLATALAPLKSWVKRGYLPDSWLRMDVSDVRNLVERGNASMFMTFLDEHRGINASAIDRFETQRFPAFPDRAAASVVGPMLAAGLPAKGGERDLALGFLAFCLSAEGQKRLCSVSGNAPAVAAVSALDVQARDARQWAIMSERVLQGPRADSGLSESRSHVFAEDLRVYLVREAQK